MAAPKRTPFQIEHDRRETASLYLQGMFQKDIAECLNVSQQQVSYDLAVIRKQWRKDTAFDLDEAKRKELARIDELERVYWDAFERSQGMREKTRTGRREGVGDGEGTQGWAQIEREEMAGAPGFLAGVMSCIKKRCELLGLDAPSQHELSGPSGGPVAFDYSVRSPLVDKMTDEEVDRLIAEAESIVQGR